MQNQFCRHVVLFSAYAQNIMCLVSLLVFFVIDRHICRLYVYYYRASVGGLMW